VIARRGALAASLALLLASVGAAEAAGVRLLFPTDRLTEADPRQLTGRRVHLSRANCLEAPSSCDEIGLLNGLDGWSVNPRMSHGFITWTGFAEVAGIARAAQEQVARFFLSDGRIIDRTDERFDVPAVRAVSR
jgi:hypothetical protein